MDTRITKARIGTHFEYDWIKYLAVIVASIALWLVVYSSLNAVPDEDKIGIFCVDDFYPEFDNKKGDTFRRNVTQDFPSIKEINLQAAAFYESRADGTYAESTTLSTLMQTSFLYNDFVIAPRAFFESYISTTLNGTYFLSIDAALEEGYFSSDADKAVFAFLEERDAFYTYEYLDKDMQKFEDGEMVDMTEEEIEALKNSPITTHGKRFGVKLDKFPELKNGLLFRFNDKIPQQDEEGNDLPAEPEEYILGIINGYGLNIGTFNREAQLLGGCGKDTTPHAHRTEAYSLFTKLFTVIDDPNNKFNEKITAAKYAPDI